MRICISHAFKDEEDFDKLVTLLSSSGLEYWDPRSVVVGKLLREQLRKEINDCDLCIFIAARKSIKAEWCLAELGAFWGLGKPVFVHVPDKSLRDVNIIVATGRFSREPWHTRPCGSPPRTATGSVSDW